MKPNEETNELQLEIEQPTATIESSWDVAQEIKRLQQQLIELRESHNKFMESNAGSITAVIDGELKKFYTLSLKDVIDILDNLSSITVNSTGKFKGTFIERIYGVYRTELKRFGNTELVKSFCQKIKIVFNDPTNYEKLIELGATKEDFDLIYFNRDNIKETAINNEDYFIYNIVRKYISLDIAKNIHGDDFTKFIQEEVTLTIPNEIAKFTKKIPLDELPYQIFHYNNFSPISTKKTLAIFVSGAGGTSWNNNNMQLEFDEMQPFFNKIIAFGDSINDISIKYYSGPMLKSILKLNKNDYDEIFVKVHMHGESNGENILGFIKQIPNLHGKLFLFLEACHSGWAHELWGYKRDILITTANPNNSSNGINMDYKNLYDLVKSKDSVLKGYLEYFMNHYKLSEFFGGIELLISGNIQNTSYNNNTLKTLYPKIDFTRDLMHIEEPTATSIFKNIYSLIAETTISFVKSLNISDYFKNMLTEEDGYTKSDSEYTETQLSGDSYNIENNEEL